MRSKILFLVLLTAIGGSIWQFGQQPSTANQTDRIDNNSNNETIATPLASDSDPEEQSLMEEAIAHVMPLFQDEKTPPASPSTKGKKPPTISVDDLNLELPVTVHPTTPALNIPDNKTLILGPKKDKPAGVIVGGGIDWDDKEEKAKGAKITITVPTG